MKVNRKKENVYINKKDITLIIISLYLTTLSIFTIYGLIKGLNMMQIIRTNIVIVMFLFTFLIYLRLKNIPNIFQKNNQCLAVIGYNLSVLSMLCFDKISYIPFWMIGISLVTLSLDMNTGIIVHMICCLLLSLTGSTSVENIIYFFILGFILCMLVKYLTTIMNYIYITLILLSCDFIFQILSAQMIIKPALIKDGLTSGIGIFFVLLVTYIIIHKYTYIFSQEEQATIMDLNKLDSTEIEGNNSVSQAISPNNTIKYGKNSKEAQMEESQVNQAYSEAAITTESNSMNRMDNEKQENYDRILQDNFILLERLKEVREIRFQHAMEVSDLSYEVSKQMMVNEKLSKAVSLYREICYITNAKNVAKGIRLMEEFSFPQDVIITIKELFVDPKNPRSMESLIVFLSESIITTIDYIKERPDNTSIKKARIIENVFNNHLKNGIFDGMNLSLNEYRNLKEFYISYFKE